MLEHIERHSKKCSEMGMASGIIRRQIMSAVNERRNDVFYMQQMMGFAMWDLRFDDVR